MFKQIGSIFSFLTIFPSSNSTLENIAKYMYLFPIVGIIIGILVGGFGFGLSFFLDPIIVSFLVVTSLVIITGIHHADGLADFADGLMVKGTKEKKLNAMKDLSTGSAGIVAIMLYLIGLVVTISLTFGTLAGYGLSRSGSNLAFWILIIALIFRALPHSVLVTGYLPFFINSAEILRPIFGDAAPTLYGMPWATVAVLVAINQPFTIWMLRSFFQSIPAELDEAARVDGCSHFQAFRRVIMPVMWPGVITTGLFSFLLAYNDFLVTSMLLEAQNTTMVPAIASMFNMETTTTDQVVAVAAAVSIIAPLFFLVMFFQRQIVSGLTAGAVKG